MKNKTISIFLFLLFLTVGLKGCIDKGENILFNSGFEEGTNDIVKNWWKAAIPVENLSMIWDDTVFYNGSRSLGIINSHIYEVDTCNNWIQQISRVPLGRIIELSGWIKTIDAEAVVMVIQCYDSSGNIIGFGTTESQSPINGTNDWDKYRTSMVVPLKTEYINVRLALCGNGMVWFDDVKLIVKF